MFASSSSSSSSSGYIQHISKFWEHWIWCWYVPNDSPKIFAFHHCLLWKFQVEGRHQPPGLRQVLGKRFIQLPFLGTVPLTWFFSKWKICLKKWYIEIIEKSKTEKTMNNQDIKYCPSSLPLNLVQQICFAHIRYMNQKTFPFCPSCQSFPNPKD